MQAQRGIHVVLRSRTLGPATGVERSGFVILAQTATMCPGGVIHQSMAHRTTVNVSLTPELDAFLQSRVKSGRYQTTSEVVREAIRLLERQEKEREEGLEQLKAKLQRGAAQAQRGELMDGNEVFDDLWGAE